MSLETIRHALEDAKSDPVMDRAFDKLVATVEALLRHLEDLERGAKAEPLGFAPPPDRRPSGAEARL